MGGLTIGGSLGPGLRSSDSISDDSVSSAPSESDKARRASNADGSRSHTSMGVSSVSGEGGP